MKPMALNSKTPMTMRTLTIHIRRALRIALCILVVQALARPALAQTATNNCGYNAGNEYPVGLSCSYSTFNKPSTFTNNANPGGCNSSANDDAWGWFTATSNNTIITFDPSTSTDPVLHLLTGACGSLTVVACADDFGNGGNETITFATTPGTDYMVRMQRYASNSALNGSLCIWSPTPPPNDEPCAAIALPVNTSCSATAGNNSNGTATSGIPAPGCASYSGGDVWFTFVAPANGVTTVSTTAGGLTDSGLAIYSAPACGGTFTLLECDDDDGAGLMSTITRTGLTPGATYYARVWGYGGGTGSFSICATTPTAPANDDPCAAVVLTVNASCTGVSSTNLGATASAIAAPSCGSFSGSDVWYRFVAPASGLANILTQAGTLTNSGMALYSATACAGTFTELACNDDAFGQMSFIDASGLTPGQTYYVRVWGYAGAAGTFTICVWNPPAPPPANDDPCGATALAVGTACTPASYTNVNATPSTGIPVPGCGGTPFGDVWFAVVAPANEVFTFRITPGTMTDPAMALYHASACGSALTLLECDDNEGPGAEPFLTFSAGDLIAGDTYYLRVWNASGPQGTFNLCAQTANAVGSCFMALRMFDSNDDGWGGSTVSVQVGATPAVNYTMVNRGQDVAYIPFTSGQLIQVSYTAAGGGQGQIYYFLQLGEGILYSGGPTPSTGLVYAVVGNCNSLAPPTSDCSGGETLCSGTSFVGSPANTGAMADLNVQTRGCLSSDERQGNWYHFSPSASGTIGMTIAPTNPSDDYDFAIWGPLGATACPPISAPYRCSYSGLSGNTGLGNGAVDLSETDLGDKWVAPMDVIVGEVYSMYISNFSRSGLAFDLTWQLTNGASLDCNVLPVELLSFDGRADGDAVQLEWITASESGSSHYLVERSFDGYTFQTIGQVQAAGTSYSTLAYAFVDPQPVRGVNYYRLKQVDLDGTTDLSDLVAVTFAQGVSAGKPYPNPTATRINIDLTLTGDAELTVQLMDATGRLVRSYQQGFSAGMQLFSAPVDGLETGAYSLLITDASGEHMQAGRFIVE